LNGVSVRQVCPVRPDMVHFPYRHAVPRDPSGVSVREVAGGWAGEFGVVPDWFDPLRVLHLTA